MKRLMLLVAALAAMAGAAALTGTRTSAPEFLFSKEDRNPVSHLRWNRTADEFQFAIVSDRTGGHRANVFSQAVAKLNLLQPEFVITVGDLIEGTKKPDELTERWREFDAFVARLTMPFFYLAGNHDVGSEEAAKFWREKLGRLYYHFRYRDVLVLMLHSDDPSGVDGNLGTDQITYFKKALADNNNARWTLVFLHRPLWTGNLKKNGWGEMEKALEDRPYTVFCGHFHRYKKYVRGGRNYYQFTTTGGASRLRGVDEGEFDQIAWVTMKKDGPMLANFAIDAIVADDLKKPLTNEPGLEVDRKPVHEVRGLAFLDGTPIPGALVVFNPGKTGVRAEGKVAADSSFALTTYKSGDGAVAGDYVVTVQWRLEDRHGKVGPNLLPTKYAAASTSGLRVNTQAGVVNKVLLELRN